MDWPELGGLLQVILRIIDWELVGHQGEKYHAFNRGQIHGKEVLLNLIRGWIPRN